MKYRIGLALICAGAIAWAGCGMDTAPEPTPDDTARTGITLTLDISSMSDVEYMRFDIQTCDGVDVTTEEVSVSELDFDSSLELGVEGPTAFADYFATLTPGCYDVELTPLDADGELSEDCPSTRAEGVHVTAGDTTEIVMASQCGEEQHGGLDVLGVLNFAPAITKLEYDPSKILGCEAVQVCATATDADADGIEFVWEQLEGPTPEVGPEVISYTENNGSATECIEMTPINSGAYVFNVTAYDLMEDEEGQLVRIEDLAEDFQSHSSLNFPAYVSCDEPPEDVLEEIEDVKKDKPDHEEEDVLGEVEDEKKEKKDEYKEEDVLEEIEEEEKKKKEEDVLEEIEEEEKKKKYYDDDKKKKDKEKEEEDVLEEIEEEEKKKKVEEEDVLEEIEEEEKDKKVEEEDVLEEIEEEEEDEKKKKDDRYADG